MPRFVLLEHHTPADAGNAAQGENVHWDFIVEVQAGAPCPTWRLSADPRAAPGPIPACRIQDHRALYFDYEGELSGDRGRVRRCDRGDACIEQLAGDRLCVSLKGATLRGRFEIGCAADGSLYFRGDPD